MGVEAARQRLAQGETPDIISFPGGVTLPTDQAWQTLNCSSLSEPYAALLGEGSTSLPWMASDAKILIRSSSLQAQKVNAPGEDWTLEDLQALCKTLTYTKGKKNPQPIYGIASSLARWPGLSAWGIEENAILPGEYSEREAWDQFVAGNVSMLLVGPWEEMTLAWRQQEERGPDVVTLSWPKELPRLRSIQWIAARQSGDSQRDAICAKMVSMLMSETVQQKVIEQAKCLPCITFALSPESTVIIPAEDKSVLFALPNADITWQRLDLSQKETYRDQGIFFWEP
jgi:hypothetical protein